MYSSLDLNLDLATMEGVATRINLLIVLNLVRRLYSCTFENTKFSITTDLHQSTCILEYNPESALFLFVFVFGEGLSLCQLGLCAEDGFVCVLNEKESCAFARA